MVLEYPEFRGDFPSVSVQLAERHAIAGKIRYGVFGAGNFARMVLLPAIQKNNSFDAVSICSGKGVSAATTGKTAGFEKATSSEADLFDDDSLNVIFSITRHDQHASHVIQAIESKKHIFVEKPLCLTLDELRRIEAALLSADEYRSMIMVGFNRRFAPSVLLLKEFLKGTTEPLAVSIRFNAGQIPDDHWTQNDEIGGGRIIGEACHAIDLATFLVGSNPVRVYAESVALQSPSKVSDDQAFITLRHANGSISSIGYLAGGDKAFPKERVEVIGGNRIGVIDDYKSLTTCIGGKIVTKKMTMDKGHQREIDEWALGLKSGNWPIAWDELRSVSAASILAARSLREGIPFQID
jgi:predicted dehydrogenase